MGAQASAAWTLPAAELGRRYRSGELDPVAAFEAISRRIEEANPALNALVTPDPTAPEQARASARRFAKGAALGLLDGVPVAVKDNLVTAGLRTTWGTRGLARFVPDRDELPVARLRAAGAVIVGKTNVPEFTLEGYTANPLFGVTRNPWDPRLTPGGSSGGSVAGCAAGLFPLALCTDGGGSIRRPAAHTGLVGFKPSIGAIAREGGLPPLLLDFEVVGPVARSVEDAALLFHAIRGPDARDRSSLAVPRNDAMAKPATILAIHAFPGAPVDRDVAASFDDALRVLERLGHRIDTGPLSLSLDAVNAFWPLVGQVGLARAFEADPALRAGASPKYVDMAEQGARVSADEFRAGLETVSAFRRDAAAMFERVDLVVTPTTAALPWAAEEPFPSTIDGQSVGPRGHAVFTGWVNVCGHPAISVPSTPSRDGLPIGVQIVGAFGADDAVLALASDYERGAELRMLLPVR